MTTLPQTTPIRMPRPAGQVLAAPSAAAPAASGGNQLTASDAMRVIRANAWLIVGMVIVSAVIGFGVNYFLAKYYSRYTATGYVRVVPTVVINPLTPQQGMDFQTIFASQRTQVNILKQESLISSVLQNPNSPIRATTWFAQFNGDMPRAKKTFQDKFDVSPVPETFLIAAKMSFSIPKDCQVIVQEIVDQALKNQLQDNANKQYDKSMQLNNMKVRYEAEARGLQQDLHDKSLKLSLDGSTGPAGRISIKELEISNFVGEQIKDATLLTTAQSLYNTTMEQINKGQEPPQISIAVDREPEVQAVHNQIYSVDEILEQLHDSGGDKNPTYQRYDHQRQALANKEAKVRADYSVKYRAQLTEQLKSDISQAQQNLDAATKKVESAKSELADLTNTLASYTTIQTQLTTVNEMLNKVNNALDDIATSSASNTGDISWLNPMIKVPVPDLPSFPVLSATLTIAVLIGLTFALGIAFTRELLDTTVKSPRDIAKVGQMNLLGTVAHEDDDPQAAGSRLPLVIFEAPHSMTAEQFRQVRTRLQHAASLDTTRSMLITSASPGDGKTTVACNLAAGLALIGRRILLVDGNFRRPELHKVFGIDNNEGFTTVLAKPETFAATIKESQIPNLSVLTTGPKPANTTEMLESQLLTDFIERALQDYDHVIFDSGPILLTSESVAMAPRVDGVITVVRAATNTRGLLTRLRDHLKGTKAENLGIVLNAIRAHGGGYYSSNIKKYYEYSNGNA